jgi:DNA polymerase III subunit gamma/tau
VDVIEVDGASNRGITEIRSLRETVKFLPAKNPYKVYIIDEVHALTNDAFNALLKTLEEPPAHVVFIFATTEAHKLPATILSRCQRYDFRRIRVEDIVKRLTDVAKIENIEVDSQALTVIARQAEGGLRDALGLMDQVIASGGAVTLEAINTALGLINQDLIYRTAVSSIRGRISDALSVLDEAYDLGYDFKELGQKILELIRDLTLFKASREAGKLLDLTDSEEARFNEITSDLTTATLHRHFEAWLKFYGDLARHPHPRWLMEAHLIRVSQMAPLADLAKLTERLTSFLETGALEPAAKPGPPARSLTGTLAVAKTVLVPQYDSPAASSAPEALAPVSAGPPIPSETASNASSIAPAPSSLVQPVDTKEPQYTAPSRPTGSVPPEALVTLEAQVPPEAKVTSEAQLPPKTQPSTTSAAPTSETAAQPLAPVSSQTSTPSATTDQAFPATLSSPAAPTVSPCGTPVSIATAPINEPAETKSANQGEPFDDELIKKLNDTDFIENRLAILEQTDVIQNLKKKLPGRFVGYFDIPDTERESEQTNNGSADSPTEENINEEPSAI